MPSRVHSVREKVAALRAALLAPTAEGLEAQIPALFQAIGELQQILGETQAASYQEIGQLALELRTVRKLIAHGMTIQQGWARLLAASMGGYRPDGEPSPLAASGSISVAG